MELDQPALVAMSRRIMSLLHTFFTGWLSAYDQILIVAYLIVFVALAVYGFHRSSLVYLYYRYRGRRPEPMGRLHQLPKVTVQLPLFNEMYVAQRLLASTAELEAIAVDDHADVPALHGWRREIFGEDALGLKAGRLALAVRGRKPVVIRLEAPP